MKASEIMTPQPYIISTAMDIMEAAAFYTSHSITTAPVQNPLGEIMGLLSDIDLLKAVVQYKTSAKSGHTKIIHAQEWFEPAMFIADTDGVAEVVKSLVVSPTHRVLVRDKNKKLVGIISPKDLLRSLSGEKKAAQPLVDELHKLHVQIEQLKGKMNEMSMYLETYDTVFQSGHYMLHSVNKEGRIVMANERLHKILGYEPGELVGKTIFDIYHSSAHQEARAGLKRVMAEGKHFLTYSIMIKKNGESLKVDLASSALKDEVGRFLGTFTISRPYDEKGMGSVNDLVQASEKAGKMSAG